MMSEKGGELTPREQLKPEQKNECRIGNHELPLATLAAKVEPDWIK